MIKREFWKPHQYQLDGIDFVWNAFQREGSAALFLKPGFGKTSMTLEVFARLRAKGLARKALIVAPLQVARATWPHELSKWLDFAGITYTVLHGLNKDREVLRDVDVYIINYEGLQWLLDRKTFWPIDLVVFDELTKMKSWKSKRVKAMKAFLPVFKYRLGLTGTPIPNGYEDLFSQVYMLDKGKRFGKSITKYRDSYFHPPSVNSFKYIVKNEYIPVINAKIADLAFTLDEQQWLKLPQEMYNYITLSLTPPLMKQYVELKKEAITELQNKTVITAQTAAVLTTKLRQFLSGAIYVNDKVEFVHSIKYDFVKEFVEDLGEPILIAYQYRHEAMRLLVNFPEAVQLTSSVSQTRATQIIADWNAGKIPILIGHPQSIGHGLNLQGGGRHILFFSLDYNLETYQQFIKRLARQGQSAEHVFIHHLVFDKTIDEHILNTLESKGTLQKGLLDFLVEN
jgi:SNF2 family DNA or RNA helicase